MSVRFRQIGLIVVTGILVFLIASVAWCHFSLMRAERYANSGLWPESRQALNFYLLLHPWNDNARLLYAESLIKDAELESKVKVHDALQQLAKIEDHSAFGAKARMQEGRLYLLLLYQPTRAERALRRSIELDPKSIEAQILLWKLLDLTGRSHLAEEIVWRVLELSPPQDRPLRLREWFMSQFYPARANPEFDLVMGFVTPDEPHSRRTEAIRFIRFRDEEPDAPLGYACLARWFQLEGDPAFALGVLRDGEGKIKNADQDEFYLATALGILIQLGETEAADRMFDLWPKASTHEFEYLISKAQILHEVRGELAEAAKAYDEALSVWPGPLDWTTRNRKADCLARLGDVAGSSAERDKAAEIEKLIQENELRRIRMLLGSLGDRESVLEISKFYTRIGRPREAQYWEAYAKMLPVTATEPTSSEIPL